jgi:hypothetical protein
MSETHVKKNQAYKVKIPMLDAANPKTFLTGLSPTDTAYYDDGAGDQALSIADTFSEVGSTGVYTLDLTAAEMNHDVIFIKVTATGAADTAVLIKTYVSDIDDVLKPTIIGNNILVDTNGAVTASNIVAGSAPINYPAYAFTLTTGTQVSGTYVDTRTENSAYHRLSDTAGTLDAIYDYDLTAFGVPSLLPFKGRVTSVANSLDIYAWDYVGAAWEQIGILSGQASPTDVNTTFPMLTTHVGTAGADLGKARIRFYNTGLSSANLYIDKVTVGATIVQATNVYANGAIWFNSVAGGTSGSVVNYNGIPQRPVDNITDAMSLIASTNLDRIQVLGGSVITLIADVSHLSLTGDNRWNANLGGQACDHTYIKGAVVNGTATGEPEFENCDIETVSLADADFHRCALVTKITATAANNFNFDSCFCACGGGLSPIYDFNSLGGAWFISRHYSGNIEIQNMAAGDTLVLSGDGVTLTINANCSGGDIVLAGPIYVIDNAGGAVTIDEDAGLTNALIADAVWNEAQADHIAAGTTGKSLSDASTGGGVRGYDAEGV